MTRNLGNIDRLLRLFIGLAIVMAGIAYESWWGLLGAIPLATASIGWCPLYQPFKINTCHR